jgi:hypothetical protein
VIVRPAEFELTGRVCRGNSKYRLQDRNGPLEMIFSLFAGIIQPQTLDHHTEPIVSAGFNEFHLGLIRVGSGHRCNQGQTVLKVGSGILEAPKVNFQPGHDPIIARQVELYAGIEAVGGAVYLLIIRQSFLKLCKEQFAHSRYVWKISAVPAGEDAF